jgi:hypothetical protein
MATVQYDSKDDGGHRFWTARYGRYAIRIDANRPGLYRWGITLEGRSIRNGSAPGRDDAADAVSQALEERPRPATTTTRRRVTTTTRAPTRNCHPSYPDFCIPPPPPDLDCPDIGETDFTVQGTDPHGFDGDNDGVGCES